MRVLVTGATGFIGKRLVEMLLAEGHQVRATSRDPQGARGSVDPRVELVAWNARDPLALDGVDAVVHLAGAPVAGKRWTSSYKQQIRSSRIDSTRALVESIGRAQPRPRVLISGSAVGYYGGRDDTPLDESGSGGTDFLAQVCRDWESAALEAERHDVRVVVLRTGIVLGPGGGALQKMVPPFKMFVGGPIGSGRQWTSWIHRDDLCAMILWALKDERVRGPLNGTAPQPQTNRDLSTALGQALNRPSILPVPPVALKLLFGEGAQPLLEGQRVLPKKAQELGFNFQYPELLPALRQILARSGA